MEKEITHNGNNLVILLVNVRIGFVVGIMDTVVEAEDEDDDMVNR